MFVVHRSAMEDEEVLLGVLKHIEHVLCPGHQEVQGSTEDWLLLVPVEVQESILHSQSVQNPEEQGNNEK